MIAQNGLLTDSLLPALRAARRPFPRRPPARGRRSPLRAHRGRAGPEGARGRPRGRRSHRALSVGPGPARAAAAVRPRPGPSCSSEGPGGLRMMSPESCICMAAGRAPGNVWDRPEGEARRGEAGREPDVGRPEGPPAAPALRLPLPQTALSGRALLPGRRGGRALRPQKAVFVRWPGSRSLRRDLGSWQLVLCWGEVSGVLGGCFCYSWFWIFFFSWCTLSTKRAIFIFFLLLSSTGR